MGFIDVVAACVGAFMQGHSDVGDEGTMDFRKFYVDKEGATLSPWHDIPMKVDGTDFYNVVIEIPSG